MNEQNQTKPVFFLLLFLCLCVGLQVLKTASSVIIPITVAILFSFAFLPPVKFFKNKLHIPWAAGIFLVYSIFFTVFLMMGNIVFSGIGHIIQILPKYEERLMNILVLICSQLNIPINEQEGLFSNLLGLSPIRKFLSSSALSFSTTLYDFLKSFFVSVLFSVFLIVEFNKTKGKLDKALNIETKDKVTKAINRIITDVSRYISIKFGSSLITGICVWGICAVLSLDFAPVFGFIAFLANFIPTFGSIVSCILTILFAIANFYPSIWQVAVISITIISVNFLIGNILEPKILGENLDLSPFIILVSLTVWGWIWGPVGMILSVPLMVTVKIVCENIPFLKPVAIFIGNK